MDCVKCKGKAQIKSSYPKVLNGDTPDKPTELYEIQEVACLNKSCEMYGIVLDVLEHKREFQV